MTLKDIWLQHQLQQLAEIVKIIDREQNIAQRREQNQVFQQQMAQQLHAFRQEHDQRRKLWEEFCQKALEEEQQRQTKIAERRQEVAQKLYNFREEDLLRQKLVRQIHEKALEEKQQRQTEIAERRQEVARQKQRNQQEILAIREYVWGSQAEAVT
ncbi:MAG: hypothetical protein MGF17_08665 [Trichodesmium sp. MAG_R04]|nr:hypothetical protein [Trichodesmium sp. MAG_R04]